jgi:hypothetical protein
MTNQGEVPPRLRAWTAVLDRIEQSVNRIDPDALLDLETEFEAGTVGFEPPEGLGVLPEELLERARQLLEAVNTAAAHVAAAHAAIGTELARQPATPRPRPGTDQPPTPTMVDHDA